MARDYCGQPAREVSRPLRLVYANSQPRCRPLATRKCTGSTWGVAGAGGSRGGLERKRRWISRISDNHWRIPGPVVVPCLSQMIAASCTRSIQSVPWTAGMTSPINVHKATHGPLLRLAFVGSWAPLGILSMARISCCPVLDITNATPIIHRQARMRLCNLGQRGPGQNTVCFPRPGDQTHGRPGLGSRKTTADCNGEEWQKLA